jgi:hypothetical protein
VNKNRARKAACFAQVLDPKAPNFFTRGRYPDFCSLWHGYQALRARRGLGISAVVSGRVEPIYL